VKAWAGVQDEQTLFLSILTIAEIDKGICQLAEGDPQRTRHAVNLDVLEARFGSRVLSLTDDAVRLWGVLAGRIKRETGHPPPVVDTMLAATALEASLILVTRNTKDVLLTGAVVFNPWEDDPMRFPLGAGSKPTVHG